MRSAQLEHRPGLMQERIAIELTRIRYEITAIRQLLEDRKSIDGGPSSRPSTAGGAAPRQGVMPQMSVTCIRFLFAAGLAMAPACTHAADAISFTAV